MTSNIKNNIKSTSIKNNIKLLYWISFFNNLWFWLGIWVLYYLLFTDYTGIGIIETAMIISIVAFEIPSGALADLLGKKKTLILGLGIIFLGDLAMGLAPNFVVLFLSAFFTALGSTFLSGTFEAITYDTLKDIGREKQYNKVLSKQRSYSYLAQAVATIIGGVLYTFVSPRAPYLAVAGMAIVAIVIAWKLQEPKSDSEKFSWNNYRRQTMEGFRTLFFHKQIRKIIYILLIVGIIYLFMYEMLVDLLLVATGGTAIQISMALVLAILANVFIVRLSSWLKNKIGNLKVFVVLAGVYGFLMLATLRVNFLTAVALMIFWAIIYSLSLIIQSDILNKYISSKHRATSLSTFNLLISLPYVFMASMFGWLADLYSVQKVIVILGVVLLIGLIISVVNFLIGTDKRKT